MQPSRSAIASVSSHRRPAQRTDFVLYRQTGARGHWSSAWGFERPGQSIWRRRSRRLHLAPGCRPML